MKRYLAAFVTRRAQPCRDLGHRVASLRDLTNGFLLEFGGQSTACSWDSFYAQIIAAESRETRGSPICNKAVQ